MRPDDAPELGDHQPRACSRHGLRASHLLVSRDRVERGSAGPEVVEVWRCVECAAAHESATASLVRSAFGAAFADARKKSGG